MCESASKRALTWIPYMRSHSFLAAAPQGVAWQRIELGQQPGIGVGVVARKARRGALAPLQPAGITVLGHQLGHRLARVAADALDIAQRPPARTAPVRGT